MNARDGDVLMGLDRLNALFTWRGIPNSSGTDDAEAQMKYFQTFAADLRATRGEARSRPLQAASTTDERFVRSLQELMHCRRSQDLIKAESNILAVILEAALQQAKDWGDLAQKIQGYDTTLAREAAAEVGKQVHAAKRPTPSRGPANRRGDEQPAHF